MYLLYVNFLRAKPFLPLSDDGEREAAIVEAEVVI